MKVLKKNRDTRFETIEEVDEKFENDSFTFMATTSWWLEPEWQKRCLETDEWQKRVLEDEQERY